MPCATAAPPSLRSRRSAPRPYPTGALVAADFEVFLADPRQARAFRTAEGRIAKTDRLDAGLIARFAQHADRLLPLPAPEQVALEGPSTRRRQLTEPIAMENTRLAEVVDAGIAASHRAVSRRSRPPAPMSSASSTGASTPLSRARASEDPARSPASRGAPPASSSPTCPSSAALGRKAAASLAGLAPHPDQTGRLPGAQRHRRRAALPADCLLHKSLSEKAPRGVERPPSA